MIRINLLPIRQIKRKKRLLQEVLLFSLLVLMLVIGITLFNFSLGRSVNILQQDISRLNQEKISYNKIIAEIRKHDSDRELLEKKISTIRELRMNSQISVRVFDELAAITPTERLWLNSLQHSAGRLVINGVALDNATIAQYMTHLTRSPYFSDADLANSSSTVVAGNRLQSFSLTIRIVNPDPVDSQPDEAV
jgi:type IV pilus assembly protein PilN